MTIPACDNTVEVASPDTSITTTEDADQIRAVELALDVSQRLVGVTGKPGTGKSTILRLAYDNLVKGGHTVALCAPTGKAARRITEITNIPAVTIHKLLEFPHPGDRDEKTGQALDATRPRRTRSNPLDYSVVLADEYAMVNTDLHRDLIDALPSGGVIRCFGDVNQLGPIENRFNQGKPSPFKLVLSKFPSVDLRTIHRQAEGSGIIRGAARILEGYCPSPSDDLAIDICIDPASKLIASLDDPAFVEKFITIENQIISPVNKGKFGAYVMNTLIQSAARKEHVGWISLPRHKWVSSMPVRVRAKDKIIWTQNNYGLEIFNGEIGIILETSEWGEILIDFGDRQVLVPPSQEVESARGTSIIDPRRDIDLAYAITTHKSQGSEYREVVYVLSRSAFALMCRSNMYTAITRAKYKATILTDQRSFQYSVTTKVSKADEGHYKGKKK